MRLGPRGGPCHGDHAARAELDPLDPCVRELVAELLGHPLADALEEAREPLRRDVPEHEDLREGELRDEASAVGEALLAEPPLDERREDAPVRPVDLLPPEPLVDGRAEPRLQLRDAVQPVGEAPLVLREVLPRARRSLASDARCSPIVERARSTRSVNLSSSRIQPTSVTRSAMNGQTTRL